MVSPNIYYPLLLSLLILSAMSLAVVSLIALLRSFSRIVFIYFLVCVLGAANNVGNLLISVARAADQVDQWKSIIMLCYNFSTIAEPTTVVLGTLVVAHMLFEYQPRGQADTRLR